MSDYDAFAPVYDAWSGHMTEDVDFYVSLAAEAEDPSSSSPWATAASRCRSRSGRGAG